MQDAAERLIVVNSERVPVGRVADYSLELVDVEPRADGDGHEVDAGSPSQVGLFLRGDGIHRVAVRDDDRDTRHSDTR